MTLAEVTRNGGYRALVVCLAVIIPHSGCSESLDDQLFQAAYDGDRQRVARLLDQGADVNYVNHRRGGAYPLYASVLGGHVDVVEELLRRGANTEIPFQEGYRPLNISARLGRMDIVQLLLAAGADADGSTDDNRSPLYEASRMGHTDIASLLLEQGVLVDRVESDTGWTPLFAAALEGKADIVKLLIRHGAKINVEDDVGQTPLFAATLNGHAATASVLLKGGADFRRSPNPMGGLLATALSRKQDAIARLLLDAGYDVNDQGRPGKVTPLMVAAAIGNTTMIDALIAHGAALNAVDAVGQTALMLAAWSFHDEAVAVLIDKGADACLKSADGRTALVGVLLRSNLLDSSAERQQRVIETLRRIECREENR